MPDPLHKTEFAPSEIRFVYLETHEVSTSIRGGHNVLLHKQSHGEVHSACSL